MRRELICAVKRGAAFFKRVYCNVSMPLRQPEATKQFMAQASGQYCQADKQETLAFLVSSPAARLSGGIGGVVRGLYPLLLLGLAATEECAESRAAVAARWQTHPPALGLTPPGLWVGSWGSPLVLRRAREAAGLSLALTCSRGADDLDRFFP